MLLETYVRNFCVLGLVKSTLYTSTKYCGMMNDGILNPRSYAGAPISSMIFVHFMSNLLSPFYRRHEHLLVSNKENVFILMTSFNSIHNAFVGVQHLY